MGLEECRLVGGFSKVEDDATVAITPVGKWVISVLDSTTCLPGSQDEWYPMAHGTIPLAFSALEACCQSFRQSPSTCIGIARKLPTGPAQSNVFHHMRE